MVNIDLTKEEIKIELISNVVDSLGRPIQKELENYYKKSEVNALNQANLAKINEQDKEISDFKSSVITLIDEYKPIEINGNVNNAADEEDLTAENGLIKIANRGTLYGKGYKILRRGVDLQSQFSQENTIYEIRYDFDLGGGTLNIPAECTLKFEGGSFANGTIKGNHASIIAGMVKIFALDVEISGVWDVPEALPEWFGAIQSTSNKPYDSTDAIQKCLDSFWVTKLSGCVYGSSYSITTVYIRTYLRTIGRTLLLQGKISVKEGGLGVWVGSRCSFIGLGGFAGISGAGANSNTTCITVGVNEIDANYSTTSSITIQNLNISSAAFGIKCLDNPIVDENRPDRYNAFSNFSNLAFFSCLHAFYGNIRSSFINYSVTYCNDIFNGTNCSFNRIIITGNARPKEAGYEGDDYTVAIKVHGGYNVITSLIYDIGGNSMQKSVSAIDGENNKFIGGSYPSYSEEVSNTQPISHNYHEFLMENVGYNVRYENITLSNSTKGVIEKCLFKKNRMYSYISLIPDDSTKDAYIEFEIPKIRGFIGLAFDSTAAKFSFHKIEITGYDINGNEVFRKISKCNYSTRNCYYSSNTSVYNGSNSSDSYQEYSKIIVRCYVDAVGSRITSARFFANYQNANPINVGNLADKDKYYLKTGIFYFAKDIGKPIWYNGTEWVDANGEVVS